MSKEKKLDKIVEELGFSPIENRRIVVTYATENLSARVANFMSTKFYMLQVCKKEIIVIPFSEVLMSPKKSVDLNIPIASIKDVFIEQVGLNYEIEIKTDNDVFMLSAQQKELSGFRSSGQIANYSLTKNWHVDNLDDTLEYLKNIINE